jgi:dipeptidyl aminopeptidase/acylaminoacyl peptidase
MFLRIFTALGALLTLGCAAHAAPLEAYGKLPSIEQAVLSPSGAYVAYVVTDGEQRKVAVQSTADHKFLGVSSAGAEKVRDIRWAGDKHLIITISTAQQPINMAGGTWLMGPRTEFWAAQDLDLRSGHLHGLLDNVQDGAEVRNKIEALNTVLGIPVVRSIGGRPTAFVRAEYFVHNQGMFGLFRVDLDSDRAFLVERGNQGAYDWVVDPDGRPMALARTTDASAPSLAVSDGAGGWRAPPQPPEAGEIGDLAGLGRDGKSVLVEVEGKSGTAWREFSPATGAWGEAIPLADGQQAIHDAVSGRLIGYSTLAGDDMAYTFLDPHDAAVWRAVAKAYPGDLVAFQSWSDDRSKILARVDSADMGPAYALVDLATHQADWLGSDYDLKSGDVSPVKPVRYRAADGLEITGYLTLPHGRDPHGLPLVVLAHGGPAARDRPGFDWWAQALASRGYAVLQANFRGSAGFGAEFRDRGYGEFGRKMQTDLSDGVRDLVRQGVVDPKRVCIVGASYGGYAALAGATLDHGVYRCAVSVGGVSDLRALAADFGDKEGDGAERYWLRFIGGQSMTDPVLARYSPLSHATEADVPVLLIHGREDTVVPISQSRRMADALRAAGKQVDLVELEGEDHWLSRGATRLQMLTASVAFLEKNNPPN